ncbi:MAG TPA: hypothetical protein VIL26_06810 [Clostridia bacterium]
MDNRITKERFNNHLEYDWFKYIVFILIAVFLWVFIYSTLDKLKDYQKLDIFITVPFDDEQTERFEADFIKYLSDMGDNTVKEVNFYYHDYNKNDTTFGQLLETSYTIYDLVIADEEAMRFLVSTGRLIAFDYVYTIDKSTKKTNQSIKGNVFLGFTLQKDQEITTIKPYLKEEDFSSYYIFDQGQYDQYVQEFSGYNINEEFIQEYIMNYTFGIELNSLGNNLFLNYGEVLDKEGNPTGVKNKYYLGVILPNLSNSSGGGNKGVFNAKKQSLDYAHAWTAINYLKQNPIYNV